MDMKGVKPVIYRGRAVHVWLSQSMLAPDWVDTSGSLTRSYTMPSFLAPSLTPRTLPSHMVEKR